MAGEAVMGRDTRHEASTLRIHSSFPMSIYCYLACEDCKEALFAKDSDNE